MIDWWRLSPKFWFQNEPTCKEWDAILNEQIDKYEVEVLDKYTAKIGNLEVWISNYPYAFGSCNRPKYDKLPKVSTRRRLLKIVNENKKSELEEIYSAIGENKP